MKRLFLLVAAFFLSSVVSTAKDSPIVLLWPSDKPALKLTFGKFQGIGSVAGLNSYVSEVTVENLTDKPVPRASFTVYLLDKSGVRVGDGQLSVSDIAPAGQVRVQFQVSSVGTPATLTLSAKKDMLAPKTVPVKVISVPPGAKLKVDGQEAGVTPLIVKLTVGTHTLDLVKDGYAPGTTPVEITPDELPGGSITVELGGLSRDTVELRDGTSILGDVLSMTLTSVVVRVNGTEQTYDRNQVKRILLIERQITEQPLVTQPTSAQPKP